MFDWLGKRRAKVEVSPSGAPVLRYAADRWSPGRTGEPDDRAAQFAGVRHAVYERLFGPVDRVFEDTAPLFPRIDVRTYYRQGRDGAKVCTLVTSGMSDLEMSVPKRADVARRVELIFYCTEPKPEYAATMQWLAHFPHDQSTWIGSGHTIPNGTPPAPFWGSSILDTALFIPPIVLRDGTLPKELVLDGEPVYFLWVVPLTATECNLKLAKGLEAILDLFERNKHPHVFQPDRKSYV